MESEQLSIAKPLTASGDWATMAAPRSDGLDTELILRYAQHTNLQVTEGPQAGEATLFGGQVALRHFDWPEHFMREFAHAPFDHPNLAAAEEILQCWPEIFAQCGAILKAITPMLIRGVENEVDHPGSNSHQPPDTLGAVWATVNNPLKHSLRSRLCLNLLHFLNYLHTLDDTM